METPRALRAERTRCLVRESPMIRTHSVHPAPSLRGLLGLLRAGLLAVLLGLGGVVAAVPAGAHAGLVDSDPADGATVDQLAGEVTLTFSEEVRGPVTVVVTDPDGTGLQDGDAVVDGPRVVQPVERATVAGLHTIAYRVISADGHPITGQVRVTVEATSSEDGVPDPTPSASPEETPTDADTSPDTTPGTTPGTTAEDGDSATAIWLTAGALAVVLVLGGLAYVRRKQR